MTSLRIIKRGDKYVVQIGIDRWWTRKLKWMDKEEHYKFLQKGRATRGYQPFPLTEYNDFESADLFCKDFLRAEREHGTSVVKTYNTGLNDIVWPRYPEMPECKEPKHEYINIDNSRLSDPEYVKKLYRQKETIAGFDISIETSSNSTFGMVYEDVLYQPVETTKEDFYAIVENKASIGCAISSLQNVLVGKEYGVPKHKFRRITKKLATLQKSLFSEISKTDFTED